MKNTITIITILSAFLSTSLRAQTGDNSYYPPSPNASELLKYANIPVNLYSGTPEIDLPITEIKGRNFSAPITLSYHASGNKVQDIASWVGLGFSLNAGGVITRIVRGLPDELDNGYCGVNNIGEKTYQEITADYLNKINSKTWDSEPDLFYYNFQGHAGKFVLDETGTPLLMPYSNLKINPCICPTTSNGWVITDENGISYIFGRETTAQETTTADSKSYISSWYLSEIKPLAGNEILFSYTAVSSPVTYSYYIQSNSKIIYSASDIVPGACKTAIGVGDTVTTNRNVTLVIDKPVYLSQIKTPLGQVDFIKSSTDRGDLMGAKYLDQINITSYTSNLITIFKFNYSYFISDNCSTYLCKRLKLESIDQVSSLNKLRLYSFEYNNTNLPARNAHSLDHWGFYNSNPFPSKIPAVTDDESPCSGVHQGADKSADSLRSRANILTKIYRPTGGYTEFIFSAHSALDNNGNNMIVGGVRVRTIKQCNNANQCTFTNYYYNKSNNITQSSGTISTLPKYHFRTTSTSDFNYHATYTYLIRNSQSLTDLFDLNGYHIGYSNVRVSNPGKGYIVNTFTSNSTNPDTPPQQDSYTVFQSSVNRPTALPSNIFPFTPNTSISWERGLLSHQSSYDSNSKIIKDETYNYNFNRTIIKNVPAFKLGLKIGSELTSYYILGRYFIMAKPYTLENVITITYDPSDPGNESKKASTTTTYGYIPIGQIDQTSIAMDLLPRKINTDLPNGDAMTTENKYSIDYPAPMSTQPLMHGIQLLIVAHRSALIESVTYFTKKLSATKFLMSGVLNFYLPFPSTGTNAYLSQKKKLKIGAYPTMDVFTWSTNNGPTFSFLSAQYKNVFTAIDYDSYGNLISSLGEDGIPSTYAWSDNSTLLQSQTTNAGTPSSQSKSATYKPLIGVSTLTDQNGLTTSYTYDSYNRLMLTYDVDSKITNRFRYHYQNENEALTASITSSGNKITGNTILFQATYSTRDMASPSTYHWSFGDGTTADVATTGVTHTYISSNTYNVSLTYSNPEYGSATASIPLVIAQAPQISICASGPVKIDLCNGVSPVAGNCTSGSITNNSSTTLTASTSGGCSSLSLNWQYKDSSGQWIYFSLPAPSGFIYRTIGNYTVHCIATDNCGNSVTSNEIVMSIYKSTNCQ